MVHIPGEGKSMLLIGGTKEEVFSFDLGRKLILILEKNSYLYPTKFLKNAVCLYFKAIFFFFQGFRLYL